MIILTADTASIEVPYGALIVRHRDYPAPEPSVRYEDYSPTMLNGKTRMVVVGLSRILTPANRTKVGQHLLRPIEGVQRISVDRTLFVVEPWRSWWHFGCVGAKYREYTYSYLAESRWKAGQEGIGEDPFSLDEIERWGKGVITSLDPTHFNNFDIKILDMGADVERDYQALKSKCFDEEHTPAAIIKRLSDFAQTVCPFRAVPTPSQLFKHTSHVVVATDLGVDRWLVSQLQGLVDLTNGIAGRFYHGGH
jgi:hypothetical protein